MESVKIIRKPETVSYEDIHNVIASAHSTLRDNVTLNTTNMSGEELKRIIGDSGICLTAYVEDRLAGTASICWETIKRWGYNEKFGVIRFVAVEPWAQGKGVGTALIREALSICTKQHKKSLVSLVYDNTTAKKLYEKIGYVTIMQYGSGHYCITMSYGIPFYKCIYYSSISFIVSRMRRFARSLKHRIVIQ